MPDYQQFREVFAAFVGRDVFLNFIQSSIPEKRLRFWQERLWGKFVAAHPEHQLSLAELREALRSAPERNQCSLHGDELHSVTVKAFQGCVDYATEYYGVRSEKFPFACLDAVSTEGNPNIDLVELRYCKKCRAAYWEYQYNFFRRISDETYRFQHSMLIRRVELEDYLTFNGQVDPAGFDERTQGRLQQRRDDVAELLQPGDELWEWREEPPHSRIGGLVLMRGEQAVVAWGDYKP
jgi:hypothetical protein